MTSAYTVKRSRLPCLACASASLTGANVATVVAAATSRVGTSLLIFRDRVLLVMFNSTVGAIGVAVGTEYGDHPESWLNHRELMSHNRTQSTIQAGAASAHLAGLQEYWQKTLIY